MSGVLNPTPTIKWRYGMADILINMSIRSAESRYIRPRIGRCFIPWSLPLIQTCGDKIFAWLPLVLLCFMLLCNHAVDNGEKMMR